MIPVYLAGALLAASTAFLVVATRRARRARRHLDDAQEALRTAYAYWIRAIQIAQQAQPNPLARASTRPEEFH